MMPVLAVLYAAAVLFISWQRELSICFLLGVKSTYGSTHNKKKVQSPFNYRIESYSEPGTMLVVPGFSVTHKPFYVLGMLVYLLYSFC